MTTKWIPFVLVICCLWLDISAYAAQEPQRLESGKPIEREVAGGESHTYELALQLGQFVRFRLDQRSIDAALILTSPDGKQLTEMNLTSAGDEESLSLEATAAGVYRLLVRGNGSAAQRGSYRLEALVKAEATASDRERLTAEALMNEASRLASQSAETAMQVVEKLQKALPIWRELGRKAGLLPT
jgi:hypothetical protein